MEANLSVRHILGQALALCLRSKRTLAVWLPLATFLGLATFFLPGSGVLFAAVPLSYVLDKRASGADATLVTGFGVAARRFGPVLVSSVLLAAGIVSGMWLITLPVLGYFAARLIVLPSVLALEAGSGADALRHAWALTGRQQAASFRLATVLFLPLLLGWIVMLVSLIVALAAIAFTESPDDVRATWIAGFAWAGAALLFLLLWLPVVIAAQSVAYRKLASADRQSEASIAATR